jgi:hypothetical protein
MFTEKPGKMFDLSTDFVSAVFRDNNQRLNLEQLASYKRKDAYEPKDTQWHVIKDTKTYIEHV